MARPRGRGGRRGGGYSNRQRSAAGNDRGSRNSGGGMGAGPLIAVIVGGGVIAIILIVVLLTRGSTSPAEVPTGVQDPVSQTPRTANPDQPPPPLTDAEKEQIREVVERLSQQEAEAVRLKDEGFEAHQSGDRERAQRCWKEARNILQGMIGEAETLFDRIGSERVERYDPRHYRVTGKWPQILSNFIKYIE